jgi:putative ABC transport system substrate-binding protein
VLAFLVNPNNPNAEPDIRDAQSAAAAIGQELTVFTATGETDLEQAFSSMVQQRVGGLLLDVSSFGVSAQRLAALASRYAIPAIRHMREYVLAGGLMSYGASGVDAWRHCGVYVARIIKGEKPANLPVQQSTKFDLVVSLKAAKSLGLTLPPTLLAIADEVIE